jgi:acyl-CoA thioesterase-1
MTFEVDDMLTRLLTAILIFYLPAASAAGKSILVLGDSLSDSYGISVEQGWVTLLQERLIDRDYDYRVVNASISGDTTSGAYSRLTDLLNTSPFDIAIVELGGNDGLRGLPLEEMQKNLSKIITLLVEHHVRVLLIPIELPPNYGQIYTTQFQEVYQRLGAAHDVVLGKFLLDGIALNPELMQADGIHPKANAQHLILENIWPYLEPMLAGWSRNQES